VYCRNCDCNGSKTQMEAALIVGCVDVYARVAFTPA
jgi:hypothetical protein